MRPITALVAPVALTIAGCAAITPIARAVEPSFEAQRLSDHIRTLSDDSFEGRGPATQGERKTVDYLVEQFRSIGLKPGGDLVNGQRQWTQRVPLLRSELATAPDVSVQTSAGALPLAQGQEVAVRSPMSGQTQVSIDKAPLVFVGYGTSAPERGWDDFKDTDVKGKILVVLVNDPDFEGGEGDFGGKAMTYYGRWTYKYEEAARRGAAGVMIVHETEPASYGWETVKNSNANTMFDIVRENPASAHTSFESWIQRDTAISLFRAAGLDFEAMKSAARRKDFRPVDLKASLTANLQAKTDVIDTHNVAALLPGSLHPKEYVVYTAHHDHIGVGAPDANGDRIFNGAIDNASGIAFLIEQGRAFAAAPRPQRSVLFLAVGAEEKGLLGSEYYASNPLYPLEKTVAVLNTDSMGVHGAARDYGISGLVKLELLDLLIDEGTRRGRHFTPDARPEAGGFFRSDHFAFAKRGVPAISFKAGSDLVVGGVERGRAISAEYTAKRYHQPDDEWQADWDYGGMISDAQLLFSLGQRLANGNLWPNWSADSEFRSARDRTAAARQ